MVKVDTVSVSFDKTPDWISQIARRRHFVRGGHFGFGSAVLGDLNLDVSGTPDYVFPNISFCPFSGKLASRYHYAVSLVDLFEKDLS